MEEFNYSMGFVNAQTMEDFMYLLEDGQDDLLIQAAENFEKEQATNFKGAPSEPVHSSRSGSEDYEGERAASFEGASSNPFRKHFSKGESGEQPEKIDSSKGESGEQPEKIERRESRGFQDATK